MLKCSVWTVLLACRWPGVDYVEQVVVAEAIEVKSPGSLVLPLSLSHTHTHTRTHVSECKGSCPLELWLEAWQHMIESHSSHVMHSSWRRQAWPGPLRKGMCTWPFFNMDRESPPVSLRTRSRVCRKFRGLIHCLISSLCHVKTFNPLCALCCHFSGDCGTLGWAFYKEYLG